ncbi:serine hydrolase domain-containing protein [Jidongwangia harbinensis]|uniref:serine hydrolase domain-containing protein n=1 Tax=Jidongwangia harbinensis TaxID=2878561 RepID=UPI001CDA40C5|nr:serine hydrolase domain-containing protein [Jidongwangia harbinensis]MCA2212913.1 beta-lactamase family protein [Jidongwangia harbinensis]
MSDELCTTGRVAPGFEAVREAFTADPRGGSALAVIAHGEVVVNLREGFADAGRTVPWGEDTLVNVYSAGKPVIAYAVLLLAERGALGLDEPVARYWPEFRAGASVRQVLAHTSGLPAFPVPRDAGAWIDWDLLCADLARAEPEWPPGTVAAEHALTYGHLLGELVRRVDGRPPARFVAEEIAAPGGLDFGFGLGPADVARCAELEYETPDWPQRMLGAPGSLHARAVSNPAGARDLAVVNGSGWRSASVPAVNLHATAMSLARFYAGLMDAPIGASMASPQFAGVDRFLDQDVVWGLGVQLEPDSSWGMGGLGGNAAWADPVRGQAIGYVTRRLGDFAAVERIESALADS